MPPPATAPQSAPPPMAVPNAPAPVAQTSQGLGKALWLREEFKKPPNKRHPSLRALKDPQDFQLYGPQVFDQMAAQDQNFANHWESIAAGEAPQSQTGLPKLPKKYREMPNAPTGSPAEFDPVSGQLSRAGKSPRANQTFKDMADQLTSRRNAATQAVADTKAAQIDDVAGTVDRSIAARDNQLAKDGVTDMGGGNMAMRNKYGAGFVTTGNAPRALGSKPGAVRDENGVVDMKASVAGNTIVNTPGNPEDLPTRAESMQGIEKNIALMAPGAVERRAADRNAIVASTQKRVNANMDANRPVASVINKGLPAVAAKPAVPGQPGWVAGVGAPPQAGSPALPAAPAPTAPHAWPGQPGYGENFPQVRARAIEANQAETRGASPYAPETIGAIVNPAGQPQATPTPFPFNVSGPQQSVDLKRATAQSSLIAKNPATSPTAQQFLSPAKKLEMQQSQINASPMPRVSNTMPPAPVIAQTPKKKPVQ